MTKSKKVCRGCRDNFYNGNNPLGVTECWCYADAKIKRRWWCDSHTPMGQPGAFVEVRTFGCYRRDGAVYVDNLPGVAVEPVRLSKGAKQ